MDEIKGKLKGIMDEVEKHVVILEKQNTVLRTALKELLEEEDVKMIPGYELLKETYQNYIDNSVLDNTEHILKPSAAGYDPLHAPPGSRKGKMPVKTKLVPKMQPGPSKYSQDMPDLNVCMIGEPSRASASKKVVTSAPSVPSVPSVPVVPPIEVIATGMSVYVVEIDGIQYYFHQGYLYDKDNMLRVGDITTGGFSINGTLRPLVRKPVKLMDDPISDEYPEFYEDSERTTIYKEISEGLLQAVGSADEEGMKLW